MQDLLGEAVELAVLMAFYLRLRALHDSDAFRNASAGQDAFVRWEADADFFFVWRVMGRAALCGISTSLSLCGMRGISCI
jgi:hypothetical protein